MTRVTGQPYNILSGYFVTKTRTRIKILTIFSYKQGIQRNKWGIKGTKYTPRNEVKLNCDAQTLQFKKEDFFL